MPSTIAASGIDSLHTRVRSFASLAAWATIFVSAAVLAAWTVGRPPWLLALSPHSVTMKPVTAIGFLLSGSALLLLKSQIFLTATRHRLAQGLAVLVILIGLGTTIEFTTGLDLQFENLLFRSAFMPQPFLIRDA